METKNTLEKIIKELERIDNECNNNENILELAIYLYCRYGEIPVEIYDKIEIASNILKEYDSIFDEDINDRIENLLQDEDFED